MYQTRREALNAQHTAVKRAAQWHRSNPRLSELRRAQGQRIATGQNASPVEEL